MERIFVTGIGTGVGKTFISASLAKALEADYWKPVQAGFSEGTDSEWVANMLKDTGSVVHPEVYRLAKPASPHIAAREEGITIDFANICKQITQNDRTLLIEGAGG